MIDRQDLLAGDELWKKVSNEEFGIDDLVAIFESIGCDLKNDIKKSINNHD